jgi:hypothetical protein
MARASMSKLIILVRDLIGDPAGDNQIFSDDQIERSLDVHRWDLRYVPLKPLPRRIGGAWQYLDWYGDPYWEDDVELFGADFATLTPIQSDALHGHWSFAVHQIAVFASGKIYDPYGAAADLLQMWAGLVATEYDVDADGARMNRSQKRQALLDLAASYRLQQRVVIASQERDDVW